jgi:hypothetical protein
MSFPSFFFTSKRHTYISLLVSLQINNLLTFSFNLNIIPP